MFKKAREKSLDNKNKRDIIKKSTSKKAVEKSKKIQKKKEKNLTSENKDGRLK